MVLGGESVEEHAAGYQGEPRANQVGGVPAGAIRIMAVWETTKLEVSLGTEEVAADTGATW